MSTSQSSGHEASAATHESERFVRFSRLSCLRDRTGATYFLRTGVQYITYQQTLLKLISQAFLISLFDADGVYAHVNDLLFFRNEVNSEEGVAARAWASLAVGEFRLLFWEWTGCPRRRI